MLSDPQYSTAIIAALSAIFGAAVGGLSAVLGTWLTKRSEERQHMRDLVLKAALENYKNDREIAAMMASRFPSRVYKLPPLAEYILSMARVVPLLDRHLTPEQAEHEVAELQVFLAKVNRQWKDHFGRSQDESAAPVAPSSDSPPDGT